MENTGQVNRVELLQQHQHLTTNQKSQQESVNSYDSTVHSDWINL